MIARGDEALTAIREAMQSADWRLERVVTFGHGGAAVQVYRRKPGSNGRGSKVGPLLFPSEGQSLADVLTMLGSLAVTA